MSSIANLDLLARIFKNIRDNFILNYDYIALSDQDDVWDNDKLYRAISSLDKFKCDAYSSSVNAFWPSGENLEAKFRPYTVRFSI